MDILSYSMLWREEVQKEDNIKTFFFNHQVVVTVENITIEEIDTELLKDRKAELKIIDSKNHNIQESRTREQDLKNFFVRNELKILRELKPKNSKPKNPKP